MIIYLCIKYESYTPMHSKDIARKPFFVRTGRDVRTYVRTDKSDAICPHHYKWRVHKNPFRSNRREAPHLSSNNEDLDTRVVLHAQHATSVG